MTNTNLRIVALGLLLAVLVGCAQAPDASAPTSVERRGIEDTKAQVSRYIDPETGCEYLVSWIYKGGGLTPRLGPGGEPMCPPKLRSPVDAAG